jgi:hypothetical protein
MATMEARGFIDILAREGFVLGRPGGQVCEGRHCFAVVTPEQRKATKGRKRSEKWERENLLWLAMPPERPDLRAALRAAHLGPDHQVRVSYAPAFPLGVVEAIEPLAAPPLPHEQPGLGLD